MLRGVGGGARASVIGLQFEGSRHVAGLSATMALRMFGLFMLLPVIAPYAAGLEGGSSPAMIGLAVGIYGLTQAGLQIPMGLLSDRVDRRMVIAFGLALFISGGVIAHLAVDVGGLIVGRALQGAGAIASTVLAFTADLVDERHRSKSMAVIGIGIGGAFAAAMVAGPPLAGLIGVKWMLALSAALGALALIPVLAMPAREHRYQFPSFRRALHSVELWKLCGGIFCVHFTLAVVFVAVPLELAKHITLHRQWMVYTPAFALSLAVAVPLIVKNDAKPLRAATQGLSYLVLAGALLLMGQALAHGLWGIGLFLTLFFAGFNALETILPAEVSRTAPSAFRGASMGIYSTCQFAGAFVGAMVGAQYFFLAGPSGIGFMASTLLAAWIVVSFIRKEAKE